MIRLIPETADLSAVLKTNREQSWTGRCVFYNFHFSKSAELKTWAPYQRVNHRESRAKENNQMLMTEINQFSFSWL